ncbi:MAG TPA: DUF6498-containing protein [Chthoniobacterales bacterium]|nr:DUF6498-containing protein [Chthoniobacterales bacterium]
MRGRALLLALGLNAVPALGWFVGEWSAGTTLLLYWLETLVGTLLVAIRIVVHRRVRPSKGHWDYKAPQGKEGQSNDRSTYLSAFLVPALAFTVAHGVFLGALGLIMISKHHSPEARIDVHSLLAGLTAIAFFQVADFGFDLVWLRTQPFAWIERLGNLSLSRVLVIHLTIVGGMMAMMFTGANRNFFAVFIFLKTMLNFSLAVPQYQPKTPPRWLSSVMDRVPGKKGKDANFAAFWKRTDDEEAARVTRNEEPATKS